MSRRLENRRKAARTYAGVILGLLLPGVMGGCPEFQNTLVGAVESATQSVIVEGGDPNEAISAVSSGILDSVIDLFFDQFRADSSL